LFVLIKDHFRIISSAAVRTHDKAHILKYLSSDVEFKDVTDELICLGIFGPKSRDLLSKITKEDLSNENFKFGTGKNIKSKFNRCLGSKIVLCW
jgi:glycine cleavage system aminomethyltransferase T